jgi:hypothetical protein
MEYRYTQTPDRQAIVKVQLTGTKTWACDAIIDTGAGRSHFPVGRLDELGLTLAECAPSLLVSINPYTKEETVLPWHKVGIRVMDRFNRSSLRSVDVMMLIDPQISEVLLGMDFLSNFTLTLTPDNFAIV